MNKIIIIFGLMLLLIGGVAFYQFSGNLTRQMKPTAKVTINKQTFNVEVVRNSKDQQIGLTKYNSIQPNQGMLFLFTTPERYNFWMKNMKFPIDIIFIRNDTVVYIAPQVPPVKANEKNPPLYRPTVPADKVLEIQSGLAEKYNIKPGNKVEFDLQK